MTERRKPENAELRKQWAAHRPFVTIQEYAEAWSVDPRTVKKWGEAGLVEIVRVQLPGQRPILRVADESPRRTPNAEWAAAYAAYQPLPQPESDLPPTCGVYFVQCGDFIKIGRAADLQQRFKSLSTANPFPLKLMYFIPCPDGDRAGEIERQMHSRFHALRHTGEWFRDCDELRAYLHELESKTPATDTA